MSGSAPRRWLRSSAYPTDDLARWRALRGSLVGLSPGVAAAGGCARAAASDTPGPGKGGMLEEMLPPAVAAVEAFGDVPDAVLFPAEEAALGRAVDKRRREFSTVRACARGGACPAWPAARPDRAWLARCAAVAVRHRGQHDSLRRLPGIGRCAHAGHAHPGAGR